MSKLLDMIRSMTPQEFSIFVANGLLIPALFIVLIFTLLKRDKKRDRRDTQLSHESRQREEDLRIEKEEAETKLFKELKDSRKASVEREKLIRDDGIERERIIKDEAAKRESMLMKGFGEITFAIHGLVDEFKEVKHDVRILKENDVKEVI